MTMENWLLGPNSLLYSSSAVIIILILMLFMSIKLYKSYRNKQVYQLLITALLFSIAKQCLLVVLNDQSLSQSIWLYLTFTVMQIITFIIINFVFMKLYTAGNASLKIIPFIIMCLIALIVAGFQYAWLAPISGPLDQLSLPALDLYGFIVIFIIMLETRNADMNGKYYASLILFLTAELARIADVYIFEQEMLWLTLIGHLLPIVYYSLLFILLFDWVIERLLSTYQSSILDGLTGLYNRRHFQIRAKKLLMQDKPLAIIFCDIDNFKRLNDTEGHHVGDSMLKQTAEIMREESSGIGFAGRYGGEELLACISTNRIKPELIAESIRRRVEHETSVTVSVGVSTFKESKSVEQMIEHADEAMYHSKTTGKNKVTAFAKIHKKSSAQYDKG